MAKLAWDETGKKLYETGTSQGALFPVDATGAYGTGVAWNGLQKVTENPDGAEETSLYADDQKYLGLTSVENWKGKIEAYTYPQEFAACDGSAALVQGIKGITVSQQTRLPFGLVYKTLVGNDTQYNDHGYKLHLIYGLKAQPSERAYASVNNSPEAVTFSWSVTATPVAIPGLKAAAEIVIDSTTTDPAVMKKIVDLVYGTADKEASLPLPADIVALLGSTPAQG